MNNTEKLRDFLINNLNKLEWGGGSGTIPKLPHFDLYAQDYLGFAEIELQAFQNEISQNKIAHLINCVSNLKRAIDCQLDTFLHVYNLYKDFKHKNLKLENKLEFLEKAGIFNSRSLSRLNTIRNKMEHTFEIPKINEIEVYYDLVSAFIAILQKTIIMIMNTEIDLVDDNENVKISFNIKYIFNKPGIIVTWKTETENIILESDLNNPTEFAYFLKILFLIYQMESFASEEYILSQIKSI